MKEKRGIAKRIRLMLVMFTLTVLAVCVSGCGKKEEPKEDNAMGRYLEEEIQLPEGIRDLFDVQVTENGELWIAALIDEWGIFTSDDSGNSWREAWRVRDKLDMDSEDKVLRMENISIGKQGQVAVNVQDLTDFSKTGSTDSQLWYVNPSGEAKALDISEDYAGFGKIFFDSDGNVVAPGMEGCWQVSAETGETINTFRQDDQYGIQICGDVLIIFYSKNQMTYYDLKTGESLEADTVLSSQINKNLFWPGPPVLFLEDEEGKMIFCNKDGIYSHSYGGSMIEQVVDASLCSLGMVSRGYIGFTKDKDNNFFAAKYIESGGEDKPSLTRYYYDADVPTTPEEELRIYTLDSCPELRQAALLYQIKHPEVQVIIETGIEGTENSASSDGYLDSRRVDAVKNLNTEMLAGKGPDMLVLDNLPVKAYIEKGILEDLTETLDKDNTADKILPNILEAFKQEDGKLYNIPARVRIPVLVGQESLIKSGTGQKGIIDMAETARDGLTDLQSVYPYFSEGDLTEIFIMACAYDWQKDDGTLDNDKLREFVERMGEIYHSDKQEKNTDNGTAGGNKIFEEGIGLGLFQVYLDSAKLTFGEVCSPAQVEMIESIIKCEPGLAWDYLVEGSYRPWMNLGISKKAENLEQAEEFLLYLMSEEGQKIQQGYGISVNTEVLESTDYWGIDEAYTADTAKNIMGIQNFSGEMFDLYFYNLTDEEINHMRSSLSQLDKPYTLDVQVKTLIKDAVRNYLKGKESLDETMANLTDKINLYLTE